MKKLLTNLKKGLALILVQGLILNPVMVQRAYAVPHNGKFNSVCKPVLEASDEEKNADPSLGGTQTSAACTNAKNAGTLWKVEIAKVTLYAVTAGVLTYLAVTDTAIKMFGGDINALCSAISTAAGLVSMGLDQGFKDAAQVATGHWVETVKPIAGGISNATSGLMMASAMFGKKAGTKAAEGAAKTGTQKAGERIGCWIGVGFALVNGTLSAIGIDAASNAIKKNLDVAESIRNNTKSRTIAGPGFQPPGSQSQTAQMNAPSKINAASECSSVQGDGYLTCINQEVQDPALSAMTSNGNLMNTLRDALGMPVGDFIKNYDGDGSSNSIGSYAANALGLPQLGQALSASIEKTKERIAADPEFASKYASKAAQKSGKKDPMSDFNSLMKNMMGQLNPQTSKQKADPKALVFRRLEAMSEERILEAKDISLFDRITNRYQKKTNEPEAKADSPASNR
jgi:hypothetical protein